jgi:galactose mutarotase-like enzyme
VNALLTKLPWRRAEKAPPRADGYIELQAGGASVRIVPALGGRITSLVLGGREWLWRGDDDPSAGGYEELFPTAGACVIPAGTEGFGGVSLPERGELAEQRPEVAVRGGETPEATARWRGSRLPYVFERTVRCLTSGEVEAQYAVTNEGDAPLPFVWAARVALPLEKETRLILFEGTPVRVYAQHGIDLMRGTAEHRWPRFRLEKRIVDMSRPDAVARSYACKLFLTQSASPVAVEDGARRLELRAEGGDGATLGIWINRRGVGEPGSAAPRVLALQPALGAPDLLSEALGSWKQAQWLAPGETRRWSLAWSARAVEGTPAGT